MNNKVKLIGWFAIAIAIIVILSALRDVGAMLFVGLGDTSPMLKAYGVTLILLPFIFALILFAFGLAALYAKPYARTLAITFAYGQFLIAALKALGTFVWLTNGGLLMRIIISAVYPISLPLIYAIALTSYYTRKISESQQGGPGYPPQGVGSADPRR